VSRLAKVQDENCAFQGAIGFPAGVIADSIQRIESAPSQVLQNRIARSISDHRADNDNGSPFGFHLSFYLSLDRGSPTDRSLQNRFLIFAKRLAHEILGAQTNFLLFL
jgi:hypothetical protein